ncbi:MAG TPA: L,D-transpeptidase family protein [Streptosporangiaceae bacterium]|nr:L,D-transpeptidase family protein [Streptosporangiaceae bacterium]
MSRSGWFRRRQSTLVTDGTTTAGPAGSRRKGRGAALIASSAATVLVAGVVIVAFASPGSHADPVTAAQRSAVTQPAVPLQVLSVTPAAGAHGVNGAAPIRVQFSAPLAASTPMPQLSPQIAGSWQIEGDTAVFTPVAGYVQNTLVTLNIPGGPSGVISVDGATAGSGGLLAAGVTVRFTTGPFSTLRLQQLFAQLGYLPLTWTQTSRPAISPGNANAELSAAYAPPKGKFRWQEGYPPSLTDQWKTGSGNILDVGAIRAFESAHGLPMDGYAGHTVWSDLLAAVAKGQRNPNGYTYALADQDSPESIIIWHNGRVVLTSPVNTGIPASPTVDGTFPVYQRFYFTYMKGTNPDGTKYDDPVWYVSYFNGGDAVHYFPRGGYGWYQSLGCVELPWDAAAKAYPYLTYGSLVTVTGPVA